MKRIELLENINLENDTRDFVENGISYNFYWAYKNARKIGLEILNIEHACFTTDHKEFFENLERFEIKEFTVSDQSTGLMKGLESFKAEGYFPSDLIKIETGHSSWNFKKNVKEKDYRLALYFKKN